jgi:hypothetical protein
VLINLSINQSSSTLNVIERQKKSREEIDEKYRNGIAH